MSSIRQRKGRWYVVVYDPTTRTNVERSLSRFAGIPVTSRQIARKIQKRWDAKNVSPSKRGLSLAEFLVLYEGHCRERKTEYTQSVDNRRLRAFVDFTGPIPLSSLNQTHVSRFLDSRTCKSRTKNHYRSAINAAMNWAVKTGRIMANPVIGIDPLPVYDSKTIHAISEAELWYALDNLPSPEREFCALCLLLGMRRGDCVYLAWEDFDNGFVTICPKPEFRYAPKSTRHRDQPDRLPIPPALAEILKSAPRNGRFVFDKGNDTPLYAVRTWTGKIGPELKKLGITSTIHELRHTYVTMLANAGVNTMALRMLARHRNLATTLRYTHIRDADLKGEMGKFTRKGNGNDKA